MNEIATTTPKAETAGVETMIEMALKLDKIDALERLIALREREDSRQATIAFEKHFAELQAEMVAVPRNKAGFGYKYCPIETMQKVCAPLIARHGFSYRWEELVTETGIKRCTIFISGHGHTKTNSFDVPKLIGTDRMNPIQVAGAMSTYGRRYTFIAGFGIVIVDEDDDAVVATTEADEQLNELLSKAKALKCKQPELDEIRQRYRNMANNPKGIAAVVKAVTEELDARELRRLVKPTFSTTAAEDTDAEAVTEQPKPTKKGVKK